MNNQGKLTEFYDDVLRYDYLDHVCDVILGQIERYQLQNRDYLDEESGKVLAKTVEEFLIQPTDAWLEQMYDKIKAKNPDHKAAQKIFNSIDAVQFVFDFRRKADEIRYRVRNSESLLSEHVEVLKEAWTNMLAMFARDVGNLRAVAKQAEPFIKQRSQGKRRTKTIEYIANLCDEFPDYDTRGLWNELCARANSGDQSCPFDYDEEGDWIWDKNANKKRPYSGWFNKRVSEIRKPSTKKTFT